MVVQNTPYKVAIDALTSFEGITQRVQFTMGGKIYDIDWDSTNERVICYGDEQEWWEIRFDNVPARDIILLDVLRALNCATFPVLAFPQDHEYTMDNYLVTPISVNFLIQMDVPDAVIEGATEAEDEDPSSSEDEPSSEEDCDNPSSDE